MSPEEPQHSAFVRKADLINQHLYAQLGLLQAEYDRKVFARARDPKRRGAPIERDGWFGSYRDELSKAVAGDVAAAGDPFALRYTLDADQDPAANGGSRRLNDLPPDVHDAIERLLIQKVLAAAVGRPTDRQRRDAIRAAARTDDTDLPPRDESFDRFDIGDGVVFDRDILGGGRVYGGVDGGTLLGTLTRVERRDPILRRYVEYYLPGAEDLGPVIRETADGAVYALRPELFDDESSAADVQATAQSEVDALPDDHYQIVEINLGTWNPQTQTVVQTLRSTGGEEEEKRLPLYVLPNVSRINEPWKFNVDQPGFAAGFPSPLTLANDGDKAADKRHEMALAEFELEPRQNLHRHLAPSRQTEESAGVAENVYGGVGYVPADQNRAEGRWFQGFIRGSGLRNAPDRRFGQLHVDLGTADPGDSDGWGHWTTSIRGERGSLSRREVNRK